MQAHRFPPGPEGLPVAGNTLRYIANPLLFLRNAALEFGDLFAYRVGPFQLVMMNHPDLIRDVLVTNARNFAKGGGTEWLKMVLGEGLLTSEGDFHLRQRRLMQPAFHRARVAQYGRVMGDYAADLSARWEDGARVNMSEEMMGLTLRVVSKTLFDTDLEAEVRQIGHALDAFMVYWRTNILPFAEQFHRLPLAVNKRYEEGRRTLDALVYRLIREHREGGSPRGDLLAMLLAAQDPETSGERMTDLQVRDEAVTLILAGHETTANALTWTWFLLSKHPDVEEKLHAELDEVLGGRTATVDDVPSLKYTEMVLSEAMRLYPPAWGIARRALNDYPVRDYLLPAGTVISMSQYVMHRNPRYWPNPGRFDPMRWTPEAKAQRPKFTYFPFGGGNRLCIGEPFAWLEATIMLATLAQRWQARLVPGHRVQLVPMVTLRPKGGMPMVLQKREPRSAGPLARNNGHRALTTV